jgi:hypothetical protein
MVCGEVKKNMNTKLIAALVIVGVLAVTILGLVAAQIATSNPNGTTTNSLTNNGFFGWMGRCLGFKGASSYETQSPAFANQHENITVTSPNTTTYQGYYGNGRCGMMRSFP